MSTKSKLTHSEIEKSNSTISPKSTEKNLNSLSLKERSSRSRRNSLSDKFTRPNLYPNQRSSARLTSSRACSRPGRETWKTVSKTLRISCTRPRTKLKSKDIAPIGLTRRISSRDNSSTKSKRRRIALSCNTTSF